MERQTRRVASRHGSSEPESSPEPSRRPVETRAAPWRPQRIIHAGGTVLLCSDRGDVDRSQRIGVDFTVMFRTLMISVGAAWLLAVPALCMGGVITHDCECAAETACDCADDCNHELGCGHEGGCSDDPCSIPVLRTYRQGDDAVAAPQLATGVSTSPNQGERLLVRALGADVSDSSRRSNRPYPPGDLPLLI